MGWNEDIIEQRSFDLIVRFEARNRPPLCRMKTLYLFCSVCENLFERFPPTDISSHILSDIQYILKLDLFFSDNVPDIHSDILSGIYLA